MSNDAPETRSQGKHVLDTNANENEHIENNAPSNLSKLNDASVTKDSQSVSYINVINQTSDEQSKGLFAQINDVPTYHQLVNKETTNFSPLQSYPQAMNMPQGYQSPQSEAYIVRDPQQNGPYKFNQGKKLDDLFKRPDEDGIWDGFNDMIIRQAFIRKVYGILMLQLLVTLGVVCAFTFSEDVRNYAMSNPGFFLASYVCFLIVYLVLVCCETARRSYPCNFICLALFTLSFSYILGCITLKYNTYSVIMALAMCAICCLSITIFSFNTKYDITSCLGVLTIFCILMFIFGIATIFLASKFPIMHMVYSVLACFMFVCFLAFDTQTLMQNKEISLSPEEYIFASLQLYMDIVMIFIYILAICGEER